MRAVGRRAGKAAFCNGLFVFWNAWGSIQFRRVLP